MFLLLNCETILLFAPILMNEIFFLYIFKVLGKCQLQEAVQEKEQGLDSLGEFFNTKLQGIYPVFVIVIIK